MVSKKTSRPPKSAPPAPKKTALAKAAGRVVTRRKRPANEAPSVPDAGQPTVVVSDEEIRIRAYFLSLEYRGSDQDDVDFWLLAERELRPARKESND